MNNSWFPSYVRPPMVEDYGDFFESADVLFTDGKEYWTGRLQTWRDEEYAPSWKMKGRDGYTVDGVTHWMPLPPLPA